MRKFIIAAVATGLLLLFFERSNMATTNIVGQSADVRSVLPGSLISAASSRVGD